MCYIVGAYLIILLTILTKTTALRTSEAHYSRPSLAMGGSNRGGRPMEIWIDRRTKGVRECAASFEFAEKFIGSDCGCDLMLEGTTSRILDTKSGQVAGAFVVVDGDKSQQFARSLAGSVEWIVCEFTDWAMIPLENIVSVCDGTGTKVAAKIRNHREAQGAGFALELGVDALIVSDDDPSLTEAAQIIKSQRGEIIEEVKASVTTETDSILFRKLKVVDVRDGGIGDRFCIDLTSLLEEGEGLLVSSTSKSMILVHGETIKSSFVPSRDFRINAGSPEAYVKTEKGKTKYIGELKSGENVLIVKTDGSSRLASVGRLKIEKRPFLRVEWVDEEDSTRTGHVFLQQAETVRVIDSPLR
jgi:3-dehydroquinate synthase II